MLKRAYNIDKSLNTNIQLYNIRPSIAQLVERWTVVVKCQESIGRWFKSGSKDFYSVQFFNIFVEAAEFRHFDEGGHFVFRSRSRHL